MPHSFDRAIVRVDVRHFHVRRERLRIDGEPVVLCGDRHFAAAQIFYRLVGAAVAEFQFECRSAKREAENLMTETNPKDWFLAHQIAHRFVRVSRAPPDRPGRWREKFRLDRAPALLRRTSLAGTTVTAKPFCRRRRRIFCLIP